METRQIYAFIFQKEFYPCSRFEIGNHINKKVFICYSDKTINELLNSFREDESSILHNYLKSYKRPLVITHGVFYDRTYKYYYNENKSDLEGNRYKLDLKEMDETVKELAQRYLNDGYSPINLLSLVEK